MAFLADSVARWLGRVEIVARGADDERREAERCLQKGNPLQARLHAQALLSRVPGSPVGLALLVDACEAAKLDEEAVEALRELCASAPWRGELWVRFGQALARAGAPVAERSAVFERALDPAMDSAARRQALLELVDLDLARGDALRALRWLDAVRLHSAEQDVALRSLETGLALGDRARVGAALSVVAEPHALDGRATLACARGRALMGDPSAWDLAVRAFILEQPGAAQVVASMLAASRDAVHVARIREVLKQDGRDREPAFALALAMAEGRTEDAHRALLDIARTGDRDAARSLLGIAIERRDEAALSTAVDVLGPDACREPAMLLRAADAIRCSRHEEAQELLDGLAGGALQAWAHALRAGIYATWTQAGDAGWSRILTGLRRIAAAWDRLDVVAACEALAVERQRPLRVAVVGEFNAGKSTFINALLGADVAPTGVLPTTATLHWLAWAPDPFARVVMSSGPDRIVSHAVLKDTLREIQASGQMPRRVEICAPIERLKRIELLDTPGFNAPDPAHAAAARDALQQAHVVLWLFDAAQPVKDSERGVLSQVFEIGVPVQALVNKSDRIAADAVAPVLEHVRAGLQEMGIQSLSGLRAMSARLALTGRMGDVDAYGRSGWGEVEQLLSTELVDRSEELRLRAIQRKACGLARALQAAAPRTASGDPGHDPADSTRLAALDQQACESIVGELTPAARQLEQDLRPVRLGGLPADEVQARAYAEARVVARLAGPMAAAIGRAARLDESVASRLHETCALVLRGVAAADPYAAPGWRAVHACVVAASELLLASKPASAPADDDTVRAARLASLIDALSPLPTPHSPLPP